MRRVVGCVSYAALPSRPTEDRCYAPGRFSARLACLSERFSFSDLVGFFAFSFLGDLSPITNPFEDFVTLPRSRNVPSAHWCTTTSPTRIVTRPGAGDDASSRIDVTSSFVKSTCIRSPHASHVTLRFRIRATVAAGLRAGSDMPATTRRLRRPALRPRTPERRLRAGPAARSGRARCQHHSVSSLSQRTHRDLYSAEAFLATTWLSRRGTDIELSGHTRSADPHRDTHDGVQPGVERPLSAQGWMRRTRRVSPPLEHRAIVRGPRGREQHSRKEMMNLSTSRTLRRLLEEARPE